MDFFDQMEPLLRMLYYLAIPTSLIFILQTILLIVGVGADHTLDMPSESSIESPMQYFTLRNLINFFLGFSWTGISFYSLIGSKVLLFLLALIVGMGFIYIYFWLLKQVLKLNENNSFKIEDTINKSAEVYLTIPPKMTGKGKITVSVNGSIHEMEAMTEADKLISGSEVMVVSVEKDNVLIVKPFK